MPAKAGIQQGIDSSESRDLDPGLHRGDGSDFDDLSDDYVPVDHGSHFD